MPSPRGGTVGPRRLTHAARRGQPQAAPPRAGHASALTDGRDENITHAKHLTARARRGGELGRTVAHSEHGVQDGPRRPRAAGADIDRIVEAILYLYTESRRVTKQVARDMGLTGPQVSALKILEAVGELSLSELSERMSARNSTITGIVDRMERDGLVVRERSEADRRVVKIRATERGLEIARGVPVTALELFASALESLSGAERVELRRILAKLADRVRVEVEDRERERGAAEGGAEARVERAE